MSELCKRYRVSGHVQGVFFRAATQEQARRLGLKGWVRNMPNGDVELLAWGDAEGLHELAAWLWQGPPMARVKKVVSELLETSSAPNDDFVVR